MMKFVQHEKLLLDSYRKYRVQVKQVRRKLVPPADRLSGTVEWVLAREENPFYTKELRWSKLVRTKPQQSALLYVVTRFAAGGKQSVSVLPSNNNLDDSLAGNVERLSCAFHARIGDKIVPTKTLLIRRFHDGLAGKPVPTWHFLPNQLATFGEEEPAKKPVKKGVKRRRAPTKKAK